MSISATVETPEIGLELDARTIADALAEGMTDYWANQLRRGQRAEGGPMPLNSKGSPLGQGSGGIADGWTTERAQGGKDRATASSRPGQEGGYFWAVRSIQRRPGADIVSTDGQAARELDRIIEEATS